jgi:hypothetical protein
VEQKLMSANPLLDQFLDGLGAMRSLSEFSDFLDAVLSATDNFFDFDELTGQACRDHSVTVHAEDLDRRMHRRVLTAVLCGFCCSMCRFRLPVQTASWTDFAYQARTAG